MGLTGFVHVTRLVRETLHGVSVHEKETLPFGLGRAWVMLVGVEVTACQLIYVFRSPFQWFESFIRGHPSICFSDDTNVT